MDPSCTADQVPVLIVGAGPAGLAAAAELAHHGVSCVVVEPRVHVTHDRPRAKTTSVRSMEHLRRWGVADALRAAAPLSPAWSQRVTFCQSLAGERITDIDGAFGLTAGRAEHFAESGQQVAQPIVEEVLRDHIAAQPTVDLRLGSTAVQVEQNDKFASVAVRDAEGRVSVITARYVLACDGAGSAVRETIGAGFEGRSESRRNFNIVFEAPGLDTPLGPAVQYWALGAAVPGLIGRIDHDGRWWAIFPGVDPGYGNLHAEELLTGLIGARVPLRVISTDSWTAHLLISDSFSAGRIYLVGESAHLNPPWGGHGYNTCVGDAVNIGWKIAAVERGWADRAILATYEAERRAVAEGIIAAAELNMQHLAGDLGADATAIHAVKAAEFHSLGLILGYTYAGSPIVQVGAVPSIDPMCYVPNADPGSRLPHAWLPDHSSLYDHLGPGMTLLGPAARYAPRIAQLRDAAAMLGISLTVTEPPPDYPWCNEFLLVRPDQHIAWRASDPLDVDLALVTGRAHGESEVA